MKVLCIVTALLLCSSSPLLASPIPQTPEDVEVLIDETPTEVPITKRQELDVGQEIIPVNFGSVVGEVVVGSGFVDVQRGQPKKKTPTRNDGPSFSRFISGPGINISAGTDVAVGDSLKPPREIPGATLFFNNEAHVAELSQ